MTKRAVVKQEEQKRSKVSQTEFPNNTLKASLRIPQAIWDQFAGKGAPPHQIAMALDMSPTSGGWRNLCGSSIAYGLTEGGYAADQIALTPLGRRIVAPEEEGDDVRAKVEAVLQPRIQKEFFERYNKAKFPKAEIAQNVLTSMGLPKDRAARALEILQENGTATGVILHTKNGLFVAVDNPVPPQEEDEDGEAAEADNGGALRWKGSQAYSGNGQSGGPVLPAAPAEQKKKQLFVAHGKNHKPLDDLKKILQEFKIPHRVAVDEANQGRPISKKVAELMNDCTAGVFIFTKDEKFLCENDKGEHDEVWRPSENVVYELGAASIMWDRRIIILREEGVNFPSDFRDLGYISFNEGELGNKALEILKELIALELVTFGS